MDDILSKVKTEKEAKALIKKHCHGERQFNVYLSGILTENRISISRLIEQSSINRNYGYNIIGGSRKNPSRDKVLALCIGAEMTYEQTQEALDMAKAGRLYHKDPRDIHIAAAINRKIRNVLDLNLILEKNDLNPLDV